MNKMEIWEILYVLANRVQLRLERIAGKDKDALHVDYLLLQLSKYLKIEFSMVKEIPLPNNPFHSKFNWNPSQTSKKNQFRNPQWSRNPHINSILKVIFHLQQIQLLKDSDNNQQQLMKIKMDNRIISKASK